MRVISTFILLIVSLFASGQSHHFGKVDIIESLKLHKLSGGNSNDSVLVWRGADKSVRFVPGSSYGGGGGGQVYTFSTGLTDTDGTITNNVSTGVSGGQTITGSTSTTSGMTYKATTGNGTTGADHIFTGGNNGAHEILRLHHDGRVWNTAYYNTLAKVRIGDFTIQPFALNNGFLANNGFHNGTSWTRHVTGYPSFFQFFMGQVIFGAANTGTGTFTPANMFKVDYNGNVALGGTAISTTLGTFTGATVIVTPTLTAFGGTTSSFPGLLRSSANLVVRLADNSANTDLEVADEAYSESTWNGSNEVPTKNAVRDKIESMPASGNLTGGNIITNIDIISDADYTVQTADYSIVYTTATASRTITLPSAAGSTGRILIIANNTGNTPGVNDLAFSTAVKFAPSSTTTVIPAQQRFMIQSDGTDWWVIMHK